jgi:hypothetical protein
MLINARKKNLQFDVTLPPKSDLHANKSEFIYETKKFLSLVTADVIQVDLWSRISSHLSSKLS